MNRWIRTTLAVTALVLTCSAASSAHALFFFAKKEQLVCMVLTEHPGSGRGGKDLAPVPILNGVARISAVADLPVKGVVWMKGARVSAVLANDAKGTPWLSVSFGDGKGKLLKSDRSVLSRTAWTTMTWENWPANMAYLGLQCMIGRA